MGKEPESQTVGNERLFTAPTTLLDVNRRKNYELGSLGFVFSAETTSYVTKSDLYNRHISYFPLSQAL